MLWLRGSVFLQVGGHSMKGGWMTKSVADSQRQARTGFDLMVQEYLSEGYTQVDWEEASWPNVPDGAFDPRSDDWMGNQD